MKKQFFRMQTWFRVLAAIIIILWVALIFWVLAIAPITDAQAAQLDVGATMTLVLAPVLAAAAAVERTLESAFNIIEGNWRTMIAYLGRGLRWLKSAETEVKQARQFLADVSDKYNQEMRNIEIGQLSASAITDEVQARMGIANRMMAVAQERLKDAEGNLSAVTSSDGYIRAKAAASDYCWLNAGCNRCWAEPASNVCHVRHWRGSRAHRCTDNRSHYRQWIISSAFISRHFAAKQGYAG